MYRTNRPQNLDISCIADAVLTEWQGIGQYFDDCRVQEIAKRLQERFGNIKQ